jgi:hypothetical protein
MVIPPDDIDAWIAELRKFVEDGKPLDLAPGESANPSESSTWPAERTMPAAAVRAVITNSDVHVPPRGVEIRGALFKNRLDLDFVKFDHRLHLSECMLAGGLSARYAEFRGLTLADVNVEGGMEAPGLTVNGRLDLSGAHFMNPEKTALDLSNSKITGSVVIRRSFGADNTLDRDFRSAGTIRLDGATIGGHLTLTSATLTDAGDLKNFRVGLSGRCAMIFDGARITGDVIACRAVSADGEVRGVASTIGGQLNLTGAKITNPPTDHDPGGAALTLDHARITTDVFAETGFSATGTVSAVGATIGGNLKLTGATVTNPPTPNPPDRYAIVLDDARITLSVEAGVKTEGAMSATGVSIGDQLSLGGAVLRRPAELGALILDGAEIGGDFNASDDRDSAGTTLDPLDAEGEVRALRVSIGGDLNLRRAVLKNPDGDALTLDNAQIGGYVFAEKFSAHGRVRALGITVARDLFLSGATLDGPPTPACPDQHALVLDDAQIGGDLVAGTPEDPSETPPAFTANGAVRARGASIGRDLWLEGAHLTNHTTDADPQRYALDISGTHVNGNVYAGRDEKNNAEPCTIEGAIRANDLVVGRKLDLTDATLRNAHGCGLDLESAIISRLLLTPAECKGGVRLVRAQISDLKADCYDGNQYRPPPEPLTATGWHVDDLNGPLRRQWKRARDWLNTAPTDTPTSSLPTSWWTRRPAWLRRPLVAVQPWYALADVYDRNGDPASARKLRYAADNKVTAQSPPLTRLARTVYRAVAGYGHYPLRSILSMIVLVLIATAMVHFYSADIVPTDRAAAKATMQPTPPTPITARTPCREHPEYPCLQPLTFAINAVLPPAAGKNDNWTVAPTASLWLVIGLTAVKLGLWALAALFLAGVTGLLRKAKT